MRLSRWDLFCTVIDNYGDIGVTWRLARQLSEEHALHVRLWVDDLVAFQRIRPEIDPERAIQWLFGVEIRHWTEFTAQQWADIEPGDVVIEALACNLPEAFIARMALKQPPPLWLNLDYLSAEDWVAGVHGLPSPHPRLPLIKYFFMPGYTAQTGGLTREHGLSQARQSFQSSPQAQAAFFRQLGLPPVHADELRVSLFCYENDALPHLLQAWAWATQPICVLLPEGKALPQITAWFGASTWGPGTAWRRGALSVQVLPMLNQEAYDRLLWACDLNFVRGEDSCVRAQFAARPMVWQAYPQAEEVHLLKLNAFLDLYCAEMEDEWATQTRALWRAWNGGGGETTSQEAITLHWPLLHNALPRLTRHAQRWEAGLAAQDDLLTRLLNFCSKIEQARSCSTPVSQNEVFPRTLNR